MSMAPGKFVQFMDMHNRRGPVWVDANAVDCVSEGATYDETDPSVTEIPVAIVHVNGTSHFFQGTARDAIRRIEEARLDASARIGGDA